MGSGVLETKEIMALIAYKPAFIAQATDDPVGESPQVDAQVIKYDRGRLLVRLEDDALLAAGVPLELVVPTERALIRLEIALDRVDRETQFGVVASLSVGDIEVIQRRKQERFPVNYLCRFIPMREGETRDDLRGRGHGYGRVTNISLGGMQFETEYILPPGLLALFEVVLPTSRLVFEGRIVKAAPAKDAPAVEETGKAGEHTYGVKFGKMDGATSKKLNRLILAMERRKRWPGPEKRSSSTGSASRWPGPRDRLRRAISERWAERDRRRRDR